MQRAPIKHFKLAQLFSFIQKGAELAYAHKPLCRLLCKVSYIFNVYIPIVLMTDKIIASVLTFQSSKTLSHILNHSASVLALIRRQSQ